MKYFDRAALLICTALVLSVLMPVSAGAQSALVLSDCACYTWKPLRIGAGGWITGLDISPDGSTRVIRTDTYGAYVWDSNQWRQLVTANSMPAPDASVDRNGGVYEIRVAPSNPDRLYMSYLGLVYRSDDRGRQWTRTAFAQVEMDANDSYRMFGQKMAVDPANADLVYVGTPRNGLFVTTDAGASWQRVNAVPAGQQQSGGGWPGITGIVFNSSPRVTSTDRPRVVYASSYGNGVWRTMDGGRTWARLPGGPSTVNHAVVSGDKTLYVTSNDGLPNTVWRFIPGSGWRNITPSPNNQYWHTVVADPFDSNRVVLATDGGYLTQSHDRGATWSDIVWTVTRSAPDIPWLAWTEENYMSNGDMRFDPLTPNRLWFSEGIGVWTTTLPASTASITWTSQNVGIEQLVANSIVAPPGGKPVLASWDRAIFYVDNPDAFPNHHGATSRFNMGWHVDYSATDPSFLVSNVGDLRGTAGGMQSGYSTNGGQTWTVFPTMPLNSTSPWTWGFGTIAVGAPDNIVWVPSNKKAPYFTQDRGQTWQKITLPGVPDTPEGWQGLHWAYYLNRHIVSADRVVAGTFYMYHTPNGLYRSTDGARNWTLVHAGEIVSGSGFNATLKSVPGFAGHLFFTAGQQSGSSPSGAFMRSVDGGVTWTAVPNVLEVYAFGFGKAAPGRTYPTLFITGWVSGVYGIWRSDDNAQSWLQIGGFPLDSLDQVKAVDGDKDVFGKVYVGFAGSGYVYGQVN